MLSLTDARVYAEAILESVPEGPSLDPLSAALIAFGAAASVTCLDREALSSAAAEATAAGATISQLQEVLVLVSGLGVHSLMVGLQRIQTQSEPPSPPLSGEQAALWAQFVGTDRYWKGFEVEFPGFLETMLRSSADLFRAFFVYCAVPWEMGTVGAVTKELIAIATDACPTHRFGPGLRLHIRNAIKLGAGRASILQTLDIAASAPGHPGVA